MGFIMKKMVLSKTLILSIIFLLPFALGCNRIADFFGLSEQSSAPSPIFHAGTNPKDHFFIATNGTWLDGKFLPEGVELVTAADESAALIDQTLMALLTKNQEHLNGGTLDIHNHVFTSLYSDYIKESKAGEHDLFGLAQLLKQIDEINSPSDLPKLWGSLQWTGSYLPLVMGVSRKSKDKSPIALVTASPALFEVERTIRKTVVNKPLARRAVDLDRELLSLIGKNNAGELARDVRALEANLYDLLLKAQKDRKADKSTPPLIAINLQNSSQEHRSIAQFLHAAGMNLANEVILDEPSYHAGLSKLVTSIPLAVWKAQAQLALIKRFGEILPLDFYTKIVTFNSEFFESPLSPDKRTPFYGFIFAKNNLKNTYSHIVQNMFLDEKSTPIAKEIFENIRTEATTVLSNIEEINKDKLAKLSNIQFESFALADPSPILNNDFMNASLIDKTLMLAKEHHQNRLNALAKQDSLGMKESLRSVNAERPGAFLNPSQNFITLTPAAFIPPNFYGPNAPLAANYGSIGFILARSLVTEVLKTQPQIHEGLLKKVGASVEYMAHDYKKSLNPQKIVTQLCPDILSLRIAHLALAKAQKKSDIKDSSALNQIFFTSYATIARQKVSPKLEAELTNPKSNVLSNEYRVEMTVFALSEFKSAFAVQKSNKLFNPSPFQF